jgi:hypothetical protein
MAKIYSGNIGVKIIVNCGETITGATGTLLKVRLPDKTEVEWTATIEGTDSLTYTTVSGDLLQHGEYYVQAFFTLGAWTGLGETDTFIVHDELG